MVKTRSQGGGDQEGDHQEDLALQVSVLQQQVTSMMEMMSTMMNRQAEEDKTKEREPRTGAGSGHRQETGSNLDEEEEEKATPSFQHHQDTSERVMPFKVEARIDIPTYDGTMDAGILDSWIDQLETYFSLYGYGSVEQVSFARLKLTHHALVWWNAHLRQGQQNIGWEQFKKLLRQEFYPMGYEEDRWSMWHGLRQKQGQMVQDFTTEFRRMALVMGLSLEDISITTKYVAGLHTYISNELRLFPVQTFSQASGMAMAIERKNKPRGDMTSTSQKAPQQQQQNTTTNKQKKNNKWKNKNAGQSSTSYSGKKTGLYCEHCKLTNHSKERCWKLHPEFYPEKFKKQ